MFLLSFFIFLSGIEPSATTTGNRFPTTKNVSFGVQITL